jgi:hypothetical protein
MGPGYRVGLGAPVARLAALVGTGMGQLPEAVVRRQERMWNLG